MFQQILVPLDGSPNAEQALPVATRLARAQNTSIVLVQVVAPPAYETMYGYAIQSAVEAHEQALVQAKAYLTQLVNYGKKLGRIPV